jgi:hypothetical protein
MRGNEMESQVVELLESCLAAHRAGLDFPTIWHTILDGHRLVAGIPVSEPGPVLAVPLITGDRLHFADSFVLKPRERPGRW